MDNSMQVSSIIGQGKVNQLGGLYINGRPLSSGKRVEIVRLYKNGEKPCNISRRLQVSHGAVSKILNRYMETGSIQPGQIGGTARTRKTVVHFEKEIKLMKEMNPDMTAKEIRQNLIVTGKCTRDNAPTESSIARRLTSFKRSKVLQKRQEIEGSLHLFKAEEGVNRVQQQPMASATPPTGTNKLTHSIENILNSPLDSVNSTLNSSSVSSATVSTIDDSCTDDEDSGKSTAGNNENKRNRTAFTSDQVKVLEDKFERQIYPDDQEKQDIIEATGLDLNRVNTWFSNRRARFRKSCGYSLGTDMMTPPSMQLQPTPQMQQLKASGIHQQNVPYPMGLLSQMQFPQNNQNARMLLPHQLAVPRTIPTHPSMHPGQDIPMFQQPMFNLTALMFLQKLQQHQ